jgi:hypothetical protein
MLRGLDKRVKKRSSRLYHEDPLRAMVLGTGVCMTG